MLPTITNQRASSLQGLASALAAVGLWAAAGLAHADNIGVSTHDVSAQAGTATVVFDFDFSSSPALTTLEAHLNFLPSTLSLTQSTVTFNGNTVDPATLFTPGDFNSNFSPATGEFSALFLPLSDPNAVVNLSGSAAWTLTFALQPGFSVPGSSPVSLTFSYSDINGDNGMVNGLTIPTAVTSLVGVAAVPEPESWALMLAGLSMVGLLARRRAVHARA